MIADRIIGKPYLEIVPDRQALARYGISIEQFQRVVEVAIGGMTITTTVEGRYRFPVRVRYLREVRDNIETLGRMFVAGAEGEPDTDYSTGGDSLRARPGGDKKRGYGAGGIRAVRQEARLRGG